MEDDRSMITRLVDMFSGISSSEYQGAHNDIDKLIANADADAELAELFKLFEGRTTIKGYRHLSPDSTVNLITSSTDKYHRNPKYSIDDLLRISALNKAKQGEFTPKQDVARYLATLRNQ